MNPDKKIIISSLLNRINGTSFLIVINYTGLTVQQLTELRNRLYLVKATCTIAKNSYMCKVLSEAKLPNIGHELTGQKAFVMGSGEIIAVAKVLRNFEKEFSKPEMRIGLLGKEVLAQIDLRYLADLPSKEALLSKLLATIIEPAARIARAIDLKHKTQNTEVSA